MKRRTIVVAIVAVAMLASMGVFAIADTVIHHGTGNPHSSVTGEVTVNARVNPKITLAITTPDPGSTVDFGTVDPMSNSTATVGVEVRSNTGWTLSSARSGQHLLMGLTNSLLTQSGTAGVSTFTDTYTLNTPYSTAPGTYAAAITYTAIQP